MDADFLNIAELDFMSLTDSDLVDNSKDKPFEDINIEDFDNTTIKNKQGTIVLFIDTRQRFTLKNIFKFSNLNSSRIKKLTV